MIHWLTVEDERKKVVYEQVAAREDLPPIAIEKDFWVTLILQTIFELEWAEHLVFKGGTSLSKGWGLIQRFSEDVDLAVDRKALVLRSYQRIRQENLERLFGSLWSVNLHQH